MKSRILLAAVAAMASVAAAPAPAAVLFTNGISGGADCLFTDTCYTQDDPDSYSSYSVAERFTLSQNATVTGAGFSYLNSTVRPGVFQSISWSILDANGPGGAPGGVLEQGVASTNSTTFLSDQPFSTINEADYAVTPIALAAGNYYLSFSANMAANQVYLAAITSPQGGAYQSFNGGAYTPGYDTFGLYEVSLTVFGVPEATSWAMMLAGFGLTGIALRRGRTRVAMA